jgi:PAS domain S-box-containing protein
VSVAGDAEQQSPRRSLELALLVDTIRDYAILLLDVEGTITTWNAGAARLKGYTEAQAVGQNFSMFYTEDDRAHGLPQTLLATAAREGRVENEGWRVRRDGTRFWANVLITAIRDESGSGDVIGFGKVVRDLTERRASDQAVREANARLERTNRELDRFAAVAAHDLQEPLRTIGGFSGLLVERHGAELDAGARRYLDHITSGVSRMSQLVDDLLDYARSAESSGVPGDTVVLADAVSVVLEELQATITEHRSSITIEVPRDLRVRAESRDVEAALRNLISNAVKFASASEPRVVVRASLGGGGGGGGAREITVEVLDNGAGIDPQDRPRLFQPFARLPSAAGHPGTGLGLAIAQRVIERNSGSIGVESTTDSGSRFWFTLPAA